MSDTAKQFRRNLKAKIRYYLQLGMSRSRIKSYLFDLMPYATDRPLIRVGGSGDGGYLLPDAMDGLVACFSPGVDDTMTFDLEIMNRGVPCFLADASVDGLAQDHALATFDKVFLGPKTEGIFISLDDWVARYAPTQGDLILQMDIEGAEYTTLPATSDETLKRFRIIVLELHNLEKVFSNASLTKYQTFIDAILKHFTVVHTHGNNNTSKISAGGITVPSALEITLLRNDFVKNPTLQTQLPHPLDEPNVQTQPDNVIPSNWATYGTH